MGIVISLVLIAFGAILTWAVNADVSGLDVTAVGVILLVLGIGVVLLDFVWWRSWTWNYAAGPWRRTTYVRDTAAPVQPVQPPATRRVVVDEDVPPPGPPPAGPPPP